MDKKTFSETRDKIHRYVAEHRLHDAFGYTRSLAQAVGNHDAYRELEQLENNYRMMLSYASRGAEDPSRAEMTASLGSSLLGITDNLERDNLTPSEPTLYFNTLRYERMQRADSIGSLLDQYIKASADGSIFNLVSGSARSEKAQAAARERDELERRIFNRLWVTHPLSAADEDAVAAIFEHDSVPGYASELFAWAIILGGLHYFDSIRVALLTRLYTNPAPRLSGIGLIGLALLLNAFPERKLSRNAEQRLNALRDTPTWSSDLRLVAMELVKTIDTDRITAKIQDELVPGMMKLRPEIERKISLNIEELDPAEMEENPAWQEMLHSSGLADKLKEMSEIQEEGGDVMMGTFSHLKTFPFFNEVANWFMPFHPENPAIAAERDGASAIADIILAAPFLCDSDKYSIMLSMRQVPEAQRRLMMQQFNAHEAQLAEIRAASLPQSDRRNIVNKQIQNAFRFFRLFRRKGEMPNPFAKGVNLALAAPFAAELHQPDTLNLIGEFYFGHGYWIQALGVFDIIADIAVPDAPLYQKMGHAHQKLGHYEEAVACYERAEMLDGRSDWTLRRLARCLMALHRPEEALKRLRVLEQRKPDKPATALNIGRCLLELERYDEAIAAYFKSEYLDPDSVKPLRPLAWCLLMAGDLERSRKYYEKVITRTDPVPTDYLNLGHLNLADGKFREAMNFYKLNIAARTPESPATGSSRKEAVDAFIAEMRADTPHLQRLGADTALIPLLIDSVLYDA